MSGARGVGDVLRGGQDGSAQAQLSQGATWVAFSPSDVNVPGRALAHAQLGVLTGSAPSVRGSSHFCPVQLFGSGQAGGLSWGPRSSEGSPGAGHRDPGPSEAEALRQTRTCMRVCSVVSNSLQHHGL